MQGSFADSIFCRCVSPLVEQKTDGFGLPRLRSFKQQPVDIDSLAHAPIPWFVSDPLTLTVPGAVHKAE
jgi:hypothetical protein